MSGLGPVPKTPLALVVEHRKRVLSEQLALANERVLSEQLALANERMAQYQALRARAQAQQALDQLRQAREPARKAEVDARLNVKTNEAPPQTDEL